MLKLFKLWRSRRRWAHMNACYQFGRRCAHLAGSWQRHRKYDALFREYLRIAKVMQSHGHNLD